MTSLDIGCGIHPRGTVNLDVSKSRYVKEWRAMKNYQWIFSDGMFLPFRDNSFDAIYCMVSLPYVKSEESAISEAKRTLKDDGVLMITHHTFLFYVKKLIQSIATCGRQARANRSHKYLLTPLYRMAHLFVKIPMYLMGNNHPSWVWNKKYLRTPTFQTIKKMTQKLRSNGFEVVCLRYGKLIRCVAHANPVSSVGARMTNKMIVDLPLEE